MMIFMIERAMVGVGGHEVTQLNAISRLSNSDVMAITTRDYDKSAKGADDHVFPLLISRKISKKRSEQGMHIKNDAASLARFFDEEFPGDDHILIIPSAGAYEICMILEFYRSTNSKRRTLVRILRDDSMVDVSEADRAFMRELIGQKKISIHTEVVETSQWLNKHCQFNSTPDAYLPCLIFPDDNLDRFEKQQNSDEKNIRVGYLGGLRREKGKMLIPEYIARLRKLMSLECPDKAVTFIMPNHRHAKKLIGNGIYDLRMQLKLMSTIPQSRYVTIEKTPGYLSQEEFIDILGSVDILLVPYDEKRYKYRGSGIIIDGALALKPFVYTRGIGAKEFLAFGNAEGADNAAEFAQKTVKIIKDIASYRKGAIAARDLMVKRINQCSDALRL